MIKKRYNLVGIDGNAHCIMNYCIKAMQECKKQKEEIEAYRKKATSRDYYNLLYVSACVIDKLNKENGL